MDKDELKIGVMVGGLMAATIGGIICLACSSISNQNERQKPAQEVRAAYSTQAEAAPATQVPLTKRQTQTLDVIIEGTTPSSIAFGAGEGAANHSIVFLETTSAQGRQVYIYPFAAGIFKGPAQLTYYPLPTGKTSSQELVSEYVGYHNALPDFPISASGVIAPNGIWYPLPDAEAPKVIGKGGSGIGAPAPGDGQPAPGQPGQNF